MSPLVELVLEGITFLMFYLPCHYNSLKGEKRGDYSHWEKNCNHLRKETSRVLGVNVQATAFVKVLPHFSPVTESPVYGILCCWDLAELWLSVRWLNLGSQTTDEPWWKELWFYVSSLLSLMVDEGGGNNFTKSKIM